MWARKDSFCSLVRRILKSLNQLHKIYRTRYKDWRREMLVWFSASVFELCRFHSDHIGESIHDINFFMKTGLDFASTRTLLIFLYFGFPRPLLLMASAVTDTFMLISNKKQTYVIEQKYISARNHAIQHALIIISEFFFFFFVMPKLNCKDF